MSERERFEKWFLSEKHRKKYVFHFEDSGYDWDHPACMAAWEAWQAAILAERERCAKIADDYGSIGGRAIADAIRRGEEL